LRAHRQDFAMSDFVLHCFAESGNAYKAALLMEVSGLRWTPVDVDFFKGQTRTAKWRENANEMGEIPVLYHGSLRLTQSGVILHYLSDIVGSYGGREEPQALRRNIAARPGELLLLNQVQEIALHLLLADPVWTAPVVLRQLRHRTEVRLARAHRHATNHQIPVHLLA